MNLSLTNEGVEMNEKYSKERLVLVDRNLALWAIVNQALVQVCSDWYLDANSVSHEESQSTFPKSS